MTLTVEFTEPDNTTKHLVAVERIDLRFVLEILEMPMWKKDEIRQKTFKPPKRKLLLTGFFHGSTWEAEKEKYSTWMRTWWDGAVYPRTWVGRSKLRWETTTYTGTITKLDIVKIAGEENQFTWIMEFVIEV